MDARLPLNIVIDCSHGNSEENPGLQPVVLDNCVHQVIEGKKSIVGFMVESNLLGSSQLIPEDLSKLKPRVSVTDACVDWTTTEKMIREAHDVLKDVLFGRSEQGISP